MENRLNLNKKKVYELPDEVVVGFYNKFNKKPSIVPNFKPDICLNSWGGLVIKQAKSTTRQYWIKTNNKNLIDFIKNYDWNKVADDVTTPFLPFWKFKKIILEEFYGVKYGE